MGFTKDARERLARTLKVAQSLPELPPDNEDDARRVALLALRAWYLDWSETAHAVLRGREPLIRLGLARRQRNKPSAAAEPGERRAPE